MTVCCSVGIMAYNEAANIGRLLEALLAQKTKTVQISCITVVVSGCTDATEEIVADKAQKDSRIRLLKQQHREGKASAVNLFLHQSSEEVLVLHSADTLPIV